MQGTYKPGTRASSCQSLCKAPTNLVLELPPTSHYARHLQTWCSSFLLPVITQGTYKPGPQASSYQYSCKDLQPRYSSFLLLAILKTHPNLVLKFSPTSNLERHLQPWCSSFLLPVILEGTSREIFCHVNTVTYTSGWTSDNLVRDFTLKHQHLQKPVNVQATIAPYIATKSEYAGCESYRAVTLCARRSTFEQVPRNLGRFNGNHDLEQG